MVNHIYNYKDDLVGTMERYLEVWLETENIDVPGVIKDEQVAVVEAIKSKRFSDIRFSSF